MTLKNSPEGLFYFLKMSDKYFADDIDHFDWLFKFIIVISKIIISNFGMIVTTGFGDNLKLSHNLI